MCLQCRRPWLNFCGGKNPWWREKLLLQCSRASLEAQSVESACNAGDMDSISGLGRSPGGGHGNPLHDSFLENPHGLRSLEGCSL